MISVHIMSINWEVLLLFLQISLKACFQFCTTKLVYCKLYPVIPLRDLPTLDVDGTITDIVDETWKIYIKSVKPVFH